MCAKSTEMVKVLDLVTNEVSTIPKSELASGMIRVRMAESEETFWADSAQLTDIKRHYWHPPFEGELREKIIFIKRSLDEVYPMSYEEWEDGFRCDLHADREIGIWAHLSICFNAFIEDALPGPEARKEAFNVLSACMNGTPTTALELVRVKLLDRPAAQRLVDHYFESN